MTPPTSRILYLHSVSGQTGSTSPALFAAQLEAILNADLVPVPLHDLVSHAADGQIRGEFSLAFDDGYADNVDIALPILRDLGVPATVFVVSGLVGARRRLSDHGQMLYPGREMLSHADLTRWVDTGMFVGSHSRSHDLAASSVQANREAYLEELILSRAELESVTGSPVTGFAYPNGQRGAYSSLSREVVVAAGFAFACTTIWGSVRHLRDHYEVPRCELRYDTDVADAVARATGRQDYRRVVHRLRRGSRRWGRGSSTGA